MCHTVCCHDANLGNLLIARVAFMHYNDSLGVYHTPSIGTMLECSTGELLTSAAFMHHEIRCILILEHYVALEGEERVSSVICVSTVLGEERA